MERRKTTQEERRREKRELRELERRSEQDQKNFETTMATIAASLADGDRK